MAREIAPPSPVPVIGECNFNKDELYCASVVNYSDDSFSETSRQLLEYLEASYSGANLHSSTATLIAKDTTINEVMQHILSAGIRGITRSSLYKHVGLVQSDSDVVIIVTMY